MFKKIYLLIVLFGLFFLLVGPALAVETDLGEVAPIKISTISDLNQKVGAIIKTILGIVGMLALVMVIYGGFMWMTSGGKADQVKKGKDTLVWAVAGLALIFFSYVLVNFVITAMTTGGSSRDTRCVDSGTGFSCIDKNTIEDGRLYVCKPNLCPGGDDIKCCRLKTDEELQ